MTNSIAINTGPASGWRLLTEFSVTSTRDAGRQLADQVTEATRALGLQPVQLERVHEALLQVVQRPSLRGQPAGHISLVHVRIWVGDECACGRGWGFFLVEKLGSVPEGATVKRHFLVELFLYQEPHS